MAIFDLNLIFSNTTSLVTSTSTASAVIDLVNARDMGESNDGIGGVPKIAAYVGTGITSACASATLNVAFQTSTDSSAWTTAIETGYMTTASLSASSRLAVFDWPQRAPGAALPRYVRLLYSFSGLAANTVSTGTIFAGIVLEAQQNNVGAYPSGFTVI